MAAVIDPGQTKTLDQVSFTTSKCHKIALKSVSFAVKPIKGFVKGTGRMIDFKGNGLWFELTGSTREELNKKADPYKPGKVCVFANLVFKPSQWVSGGIFVDLNPSRVLKHTPVPSAHPCLTLFHLGAAEPACPLDKCVLAENYIRADVRGLVVEIGAVK